MGNSYTNYTVKGANQNEVVDFLKGRKAIVTREDKGTLVVFDQLSDTQDTTIIEALGRSLSKKLQCVVLSVILHDDDIFAYELIQNGNVLDEYDSNPGYFDFSATEIADPVGGDAKLLCEVFEVGDAEAIEKILRAGIDDYVFASERHLDLTKALAISSYGVATRYDSFEYNELPDGLTSGDIVKTDE